MPPVGDAVTSSPAWREIEPVATARAGGPSALVGVAVGLVVVALLVWRGHVPAAVLLAVVVTALTLGRRLSPAFDRGFARVLGRVAHAVGVGLSWLLLGLTMLFVVLPVWVVARVARWNTLEPEPQRGRWAVHDLLAWRRHPDKSFADERRALPTRTRVHGALAALVPALLLVLLLGPFRAETLAFAGRVTPGHLFFGGGDEPPPPGAAPTTGTETAADGLPAPTGDAPDGYPRNALLSTPPAPWVQDYFDELFPVVFAYDPYLTVRVADHQGQYVNVTDRVRRSYVPPGADADPAALDVWFLGSSALYGQGQRDDHTLPSEVARLAEEAGVPLRVQNFGVPGYWAWQDSLLLAQLLDEREAPDLIVGYEGFNDVSNTIFPGAPTQVSTGFADEVRDTLVEAGADFSGAGNSTVDPMPRTTTWSPENAATIYARGAGLARDLAEVHGIPLRQYLQPAVWSRDLAVDDATLANIGADREYHDTYAPLWNRARALMAVHGVVDLGDALDDVDELIYSDDVHMNERGTRLLAEAIWADLATTAEQLHEEKAAAAS